MRRTVPIEGGPREDRDRGFIEVFGRARQPHIVHRRDLRGKLVEGEEQLASWHEFQLLDACRHPSHFANRLAQPLATTPLDRKGRE